MGTERIIKNHMDILWHEYTDAGGEERPVTEASLTEKASIVGRVGIILLSCFPCGPDSLTNELVKRKVNKPLLKLILENESNTGLITRLEAFFDIVKVKI